MAFSIRKSNKNNEKFYLGEFEEIVLLAILRLHSNAYGMSIRREIETETERMTDVGAVYKTLDRLEKKGYISSRQGEATAERGGRAKRYFRVEGSGVEALNQVMIARNKLLRGIKIGRSPIRV